MSSAVFEPAIPASERAQTHALDRAATAIGNFIITVNNYILTLYNYIINVYNYTITMYNYIIPFLCGETAKAGPRQTHC
jgi:hypothetical protein